jgi:hypothetical protein
MAGINVNQITSMLAKLQPDSALQQYAQMHKNDPYIMALASSESNRRKELRSAAQAAAAGQPQPKVADAAIAQMAPQQLPEQMGIGQLPAPNMQFAAEGGIMGYDEGYDEGGMTYGQEPVMMMSEGGVARYQSGGDTMGGFMPSFAQQELASQASELALNERARSKQLAELQQKADFLTEIGAPQATAARAQLEEFKASGAVRPISVADNTAAPAPSQTAAGNLSGMDRRMQTGSMPNIPSVTSSAKPAPKGDRVAAPRPGAGAGPAAARANAADPFSMDAIRKAQAEAMGDSNYKIGALNNQLVEIRNKADMQVQQRLDDRKKEIESEGDVYKDRSDRLVERAKGLAAQKNENTGLALLNAGLAIMSTPGKLMEAIGKGAQVGTAQYAAGIKDLRAAQERLDEANDRISELRMNRKDLNSREIRALEKDRDNAILDGQKMVFGFAKDVYGMDRKQAEATFTSYMSGQEKKAEMQSRETTARIAAGPGYERNKMLRDAQGNEAKVRAEYGKLQGKVMDTLSKDANYQMANPAMQSTMYTNALRQAVSTNPFLASYASGIGFSAAPTGKVYDLTED